MFNKKQLLTFAVLMSLLLGNLKANPNHSHKFFAPPTLIAPVDGATGITAPIQLQWGGTSSTVAIEIYENCSENISTPNSINLNGYQQTAGPIQVGNISADLSGVTYNPLTGTLFMITNKNSEIVETTLSGSFIRSIILNGFNDPEGIAHVGGNSFAISEERLGRILYISIYANTSSINLNNMNYTQIPGISNNEGLEGVSLNTNTGDYYVVKEKNSRTLYRYNGTATTPTFLNTCNIQANSFGMTDVSDIFHLTIPTGLDNINVSDKMLILSDESSKVVEIDNNCGLYSTLNLPLNKQHEGITMDDNGTIYVVSEPNLLYIFENPTLQLNPSSQTQGTLIYTATSGANSFSIPNGILDANTDYCWRVGSGGEWSDMWSFTSDELPPPPPPNGDFTVTSTISTSNDDAEEAANGTMSLNSTDLELVQENTTQKVGIVFRGLNIPQGADIITAKLQFTADETTSETTNLIISGQDTNSASGFTSVNNNISSRSATSAQVSWQVSTWNSAGQSSNIQRTPEIKSVIQEIVNRSGFNTNSNIGIIITGSGKRVAESFDGGGTVQAPKLTITYNVEDCLAAGTACNDGDTETENDIEDGNCVCAGTPVPQCDSQGTACNDDDPTTHNDVEDGNCNCAGVCLSEGTPCDDGNPNTVNDQEDGNCICLGQGDQGFVYQGRIAAGDDDVEENGKNGNMYLNSSDLELVYDRSYTGNQVIGLRFMDVFLPPGAVITNAYVQFTTDEARNTNGNKLIRAENTNDSAPFINQKYNLSNRTKTQAVAAWTPPSWDSIGESGAKQRTANIAAVIQELVDRGDWEGLGTAITIIIEGGGRKVATSYNGSPEKAPLLRIEYEYSGENLVQQPDEETAVDDRENEAQERVEIAMIQNITLYPNPAVYEVNVDIQMNEANTAQGMISLFDISGKVYSQTPFNPQTERSVELEVAQLPQGIYLVHVQVGEHIATRKFVKK